MVKAVINNEENNNEENIELSSETDDFEENEVYNEIQEEIRRQKEEEAEFQEILDYIKNSDMMSEKFVNDKGESKEITVAMLQNWKSKFGKIYISRITDDAIIYIWKPLFRTEYQRMLGTGKNDGEVNWSDDFSRQKEVAKKCLLYPHPSADFILNTRAGILNTLEQQIFYQSGFISEQQAINSINVIG